MGNAALKIEEPESNLISISEIARRLKLDKATVRSRLEDLGYEPHESSTEKMKLFPFDDEMEFAIKAAKDSLTAAKIRNTRADYETKELKLAQMRGELVPMVDAVERMQQVMTALYKEFSLQQPKRLSSRIAKAKTAAEVSKLMKADTEKIFGRLKENDATFVPPVK